MVNHDHLIDLNKITTNGKSVFTSIHHKNDDTCQIIDFLLNHGANPNIPDSYGVLPFVHAIEHSMMTPLLNSNKIDFEKRFFCIYNYFDTLLTI